MMSRDFSPKQCWTANEYSVSQDNPFGIYLQNICWQISGKEQWEYTENELKDRRSHKYMAILGSDIYKTVKDTLTETQFEELNSQLGALIEADFSGNETDSFPKEMTDWYYNRHDYYYHEQNDEKFLEYIKQIKNNEV